MATPCRAAEQSGGVLAELRLTGEVRLQVRVKYTIFFVIFISKLLEHKF